MPSGTAQPGLATFALVDADLTAVEVDVIQADGYQFADTHTGVEQRLDEHQVAELPCLPDRFVIASDLLFARYIWQVLGRPRHDNSEFGAELTKDLLQVRVVRPFLTECRRQLVGFALGRRAPPRQGLDSTHAAASSGSSSSRSARPAGRARYRRRVPERRSSMRPASRSTRKCCETAGPVMRSVRSAQVGVDLKADAGPLDLYSRTSSCNFSFAARGRENRVAHAAVRLFDRGLSDVKQNSDLAGDALEVVQQLLLNPLLGAHVDLVNDLDEQINEAVGHFTWRSQHSAEIRVARSAGVRPQFVGGLGCCSLAEAFHDSEAPGSPRPRRRRSLAISVRTLSKLMAPASAFSSLRIDRRFSVASASVFVIGAAGHKQLVEHELGGSTELFKHRCAPALLE